MQAASVEELKPDQSEFQEEQKVEQEPENNSIADQLDDSPEQYIKLLQ